MKYDIIIKSGSILDGLKDAQISDIGIKDGRISTLGVLKNAQAKKVIDASGKYVAPGFIDITNQSDTRLTLFQYPDQESMLTQGITTIIGGNCGASLAPLTSPEAINAIKKWADPKQINIDWITVEEFLNAIDKFKPALNFGTLIGYGTLRRCILGNEIRPLKHLELEKFRILMEESIAHGALGLSMGLSYGHEKVSNTKELIEVCTPLRETGGIIKIHLRSEGTELLASVNEAIQIGRETGVPIQISHLKSIGKKSWPTFPKALELISNAKASGVDIDFDVYPYSTTGSALYLLIPNWAREGGFENLFQKIDTPAQRKAIIEALKTQTLHYDRIVIASAKIPGIVGHTLAEIAKEGGISNEEALIETVRANEGRVKIIGKTILPKNTKQAILDKNSFIATDGAGYSKDSIDREDLPHPRSFGSFPRFWRKFVSTKLISPKEAIWKTSLGPAKKLNIKGRGAIQEGNYADLIVFKSDSLKDRATYKNPFLYSEGIEWLIINGQIAIEEGKITGLHAGTTIRSNR